MAIIVGRKYDLILYGASGFTGRQTVEYCRQFAPAGLSWAIAGRNRAKLEGVNSAGVDVLVADAQDENGLRNLARQTRVVASTAGPFGLYGTKLVDACVGSRTHYCDITGETPWIRQQIDRHHVQAAADGTRIVPGCGFDSIPSDFGAWLISRHVQDALHSECTAVSAFFRVGGGINGGTLASVFHMLETNQLKVARDLFLLDPDPAAHSPEQRARNADPTEVRYVADLKKWVGPFLMGSINTRVVRRTQALLGMPFDYQEYSKFGSSRTARGAAFAGKVFESVAASAVGRKILKRLLPKPGQGPSEKVMNEGFFECEFVADTKDGRRVRGILKGQGDAGNRITVKCLCESAFLLAEHSITHAAIKPFAGGGVLTPVTGLGEGLVVRLANAGITFQIVQPASGSNA
jgi:short subunit dehydrogenase-like uncharacterized protein